MAGEGDGEVVVPPTLQALLAARLDQLEPAERSVLERAAIEGEIFHRGAVQALAPDGDPGDPAPGRARPQGADQAGQATVRRRGRLPLPPPPDPGRRLRGAAESDAGGAPRAPRILARSSTGASSSSWTRSWATTSNRHAATAPSSGCPHDEELAAAARRRLTAAGFRADLRQDYGAAVSLFERAAALVPAAELDLALETELGDALLWTGRGDEALRRADALAERAAAAGDRVGELCGRIQAGIVRARPRAGGRDGEAGRAHREGPARVRGRRRRPGSLHRLRSRSVELAIRARAMDAALEAFERASAHARHAGHDRIAALGVARLHARFAGTTPVLGAARVARRERATSRAGPLLPCLPGRGACDARSLRRGARDPRRSACGAGRARRGSRCSRTSPRSSPSEVELLAGDPAAAAEFGAEGCRLHEELGEQGFLSTAAGDSGAGALRSRPARRGRRLGRPRRGARRERRRDHADALAAGQGEGARAPRRARRGGAARAGGGRDRRGNRHARLRKETRTPTSRRCSCSAASATKRSPRSSRRSSATSARATPFRQAARARSPTPRPET